MKLLYIHTYYKQRGGEDSVFENETQLMREAGVDVVFDGIGADTTTALVSLVRPGARYVQHGAAGGRWGTTGASSSWRAPA